MGKELRGEISKVISDVWSQLNGGKDIMVSQNGSENGNHSIGDVEPEKPTAKFAVFRKFVGNKWKDMENKKYELVFQAPEKHECENWVLHDISIIGKRWVGIWSFGGIVQDRSPVSSSISLGNRDFGVNYLVVERQAANSEN